MSHLAGLDVRHREVANRLREHARATEEKEKKKLYGAKVRDMLPRVSNFSRANDYQRCEGQVGWVQVTAYRETMHAFHLPIDYVTQGEAER